MACTLTCVCTITHGCACVRACTNLADNAGPVAGRDQLRKERRRLEHGRLVEASALRCDCGAVLEDLDHCGLGRHRPHVVIVPTDQLARARRRALGRERPELRELGAAVGQEGARLVERAGDRRAKHHVGVVVEDVDEVGARRREHGVGRGEGREEEGHEGPRRDDDEE